MSGFQKFAGIANYEELRIRIRCFEKPIFTPESS